MDPIGKRIQDFEFNTPCNVGSIGMSLSQGQYIISFRTVSGAVVYRQFQAIE
jgi:hypothetical protein